MLPERDYDKGSILEKGWFIALIIAIFVVVGAATWYGLANPEKIAGWVSPEESRPRVEKPVVRPSGTAN